MPALLFSLLSCCAGLSIAFISIPSSPPKVKYLTNIPLTQRSGNGFSFAGKGRSQRIIGPLHLLRLYSTQQQSGVLPAGTVVKHGTTSDILPQIFANGLLPSGAVPRGNILRSTFEPKPSVDGVYVAKSYAAYSAALIRFTSTMNFILSHGSDFGTLPDLIPLPVVLSIKIQEDCPFVADEDYLQVDEDLKGQPAQAWVKYGSIAIRRNGGIPAAWIESVECPHVLSESAIMLAMTEIHAMALGPVGKWELVPLIISSLKRANSRDIVHWQSLRTLMDDVYKLVYAYDLCPSPESAQVSSLLWFESMTTVETDATLMYLTPSTRVVLGDTHQASGWLHQEGYPPTALQTPLVSKLTGVPSEWSACFAVPVKGAGFARPKKMPRKVQDQRTAMLKAAYARVLMDLCTFFVTGTNLPMRS